MQSKITNNLRLLVMYIVGIAGLKEGDIILTSFPKSGNTWIRFFICNIISLKEWDRRTVTFEILNDTMPELGVSNLLRRWPHDSVPRIVKTHKRSWPLIFSGNRSILLVRDPRDVMVSYYQYKRGKEEICENLEFSEFIRNPRVGLESWCRHYESWKSKSDIIIFYEDLKENDIREFSRMLKKLSISIQDGIIEEATRRSRFEEVSKIEDNFGTGKKGSDFKDDQKFTRKGKTGEWRQYFGSDDVKYYDSLMNEYSISIY